MVKKPKRRWYAIAARPQTGPPPPIDGLIGTTVAAAYSLRRLRSAYAGPAINILRSSDSTTKDIGFAGNVFDAASYAAFVGGGQAFAANWYDQSGNAANAVQVTIANEPTVAPDLGYYGVNSTNASPKVMIAPDAAPIQGAFATGGLLQVALRCSAGLGVGAVVSKGAWVLYCYPGGGDQQLWFYVKAATADGFWGTTNVMTAITRHVVTVAYNASTPTTAPVITLDGTVCTLTPTAPSGAVTSDVGFALETQNDAVISGNNGGLGGSIYEVILIKGTPLPAVAAALNANARTFYGTP